MAHDTAPAADPSATADPSAAATGTVARKDPVGAVCGRVPHLSTGDKAALRRLFLTRSEAAVGVVTGLLVRAGVPAEEWGGAQAFGRWQLLAHVAAVLSGTASLPPHKPGARLGQALQRANYSELRLMRLTSAAGPGLVDQIVRAARFLGAAGAGPVDLRTFHDLSFDFGDRAERARLRIARDYYTADHASTKDAP